LMAKLLHQACEALWSLALLVE